MTRSPLTGSRFEPGTPAGTVPLAISAVATALNPGVLEHILTGSIFVKGAMPGDVLEVRIFEIDLAVPYGYNRQRPYDGALRDDFPALWYRIIPINREAKTASVAPAYTRQHRQQGPCGGRHPIHAGANAGRPVLGGGTGTRPKATARSISPPSRPVCVGNSRSSSART